MGTLRRKLCGYFNYFAVPCNFESVVVFYKKTLMLMHKWLNRRSGRRSYTWAGISELYKAFGIPYPKIKPIRRMFEVVLD